MGAWSIILPEEGINKVLNPTGMGASNVTAVAGGTPTFVTTYSYFGYKCHRLVTSADNDGAYYDLSTLANAIHYVTLRINSASDISPMLKFSLNDIVYNTPTLLGTEGNWYVYGYQFPAAQANASTKLHILQDGAGACNIFIGHIQVEENTYATTPITGDRKGFCDDGYYWNGSPNASSSTRAAKECSGGLVVDLETTYNFRVKYGLGSGMPPITHHTQGMALLPGALYQGHKVEPRVLDLVSGTMARTPATVAAARKNFINAIKMDRVSPEQPVVFRYTGVNADKPIDFHAYYDSGMEFQTSNGVVDQPVARFIAYDPFGYELPMGSASLTTSATVTDADDIVRKIDGTWYNISTDFTDAVLAIDKGSDGSIYIGGAFTNVGDANGDCIVKWDPFGGGLSSLTGGSGSGTDSTVYSIKRAANGDIYLAGDFTGAGGIGNTNNIAYWDVSASEFVTIGNGITDAGKVVYAIEFDESDNLYIGGSFLNQGGASGDYIVQWDGTSFNALGTGMNGEVYAIALAPNYDVYVGGAFTTGNGVTLNGVGYWNGTTFVPLGTGVSGGAVKVYALKFDAAGNLYIGGDFTAADGVSCAGIAKWNGKTFEPLGSGVNAICNTINIDDRGNIYAGGNFTAAGGLSLLDRMAMWNGYTWGSIDIDLPGAAKVNVIFIDGDNYYIGYDTEGDATASNLNAVTNSGSTIAYPIFKINKSGGFTKYAYIEWIKNETTGDTLWFYHKFRDGETVTIDLTPGSKSIKSDYYGDLWRAVLRNSDLSSFRLLPGVNNITVYISTSNDPTITAWMEWPITHWSADNVSA